MYVGRRLVKIIASRPFPLTWKTRTTTTEWDGERLNEAAAPQPLLIVITATHF